MIPISITTRDSSIDSGRQIVERIQHALGQLGLDSIDLGFHTVERHSEWNFGQPCPECGATTLASVETVSCTTQSANGTYEAGPIGGSVGDSTLYVRCGSCDTELYVHPAWETVV